MIKNGSVCHVSSVHTTYDVRIFEKECSSLAANGYETHLVISGENDVRNGVFIHGIGKCPSNRLRRMLFYSKKAGRKALSINADLYHLHDPELLPLVRNFKKAGKKVIFDCHENILDQISEKKYIPTMIRDGMGNRIRGYLREYLTEPDAIITVDPLMVEKYSSLNPIVEVIGNYPLVVDVQDIDIKTPEAPYICFAGGILDQWNHEVVIKAAAACGLRYVICGVADEDYLNKLQQMPEWRYVDYRGRLSHEEALYLLRNAIAGVALLEPSRNTNDLKGTLGNTKFFEIMYSQIPVICTDFESWSRIVSEESCGYCVTPHDEKKVERIIKDILHDPKKGREKGRKGYEAVCRTYNWKSEEKKLLNLYERILNS